MAQDFKIKLMGKLIDPNLILTFKNKKRPTRKVTPPQQISPQKSEANPLRRQIDNISKHSIGQAYGYDQSNLKYIERTANFSIKLDQINDLV